MSQKANKRSVVKPGPVPTEPSVRHTWETWAPTAPKPGEIRMFAEFRKGQPGAPAASGQIDHEKEYAEALKDPEFAKLCEQMGITPADAVKFHKLAKG